MKKPGWKRIVKRRTTKWILPLSPRPLDHQSGQESLSILRLRVSQSSMQQIKTANTIEKSVQIVVVDFT